MTIREFRILVGLTQREFSNRYGIPIRTLQDWETGRRTPPEYLPPLLFFRVAFDFPTITPPHNYLQMIQSEYLDPIESI